MKNQLFFGWLLLAGSVFLLMSCNGLRQEVKPSDLTSQPQQLVVTCFIAPGDTTVVVRVTRSQVIIGTTNPLSGSVANALVTFSDGSRSVTLRNTKNETLSTYYDGVIHYDDNNAYSEYRASTSTIPIRVGQTYRLRVEAAGTPAVETACTVVGPVPLSAVLLDSTVTSNATNSRTEYFVRLRWTDPAGQRNFYRVGALFRSFYSARIGTPPRDTLLPLNASLLFANNVNSSDAGRNGQDFVSEQGRLLGLGFSLSSSQSNRLTGQIDAYLLSVDQSYYQYHDAVYRQKEAAGNPFVEPVLIPSNIQGGLGCFASYNRSTITVPIK